MEREGSKLKTSFFFFIKIISILLLTFQTRRMQGEKQNQDDFVVFKKMIFFGFLSVSTDPNFTLFIQFIIMNVKVERSNALRNRKIRYESEITFPNNILSDKLKKMMRC